MAHGFFAWMGGFILYANCKSQATQTIHELRRFVRGIFVVAPVTRGRQRQKIEVKFAQDGFPDDH